MSLKLRSAWLAFVRPSLCVGSMHIAYGERTERSVKVLTISCRSAFCSCISSFAWWTVELMTVSVVQCRSFLHNDALHDLVHVAVCLLHKDKYGQIWLGHYSTLFRVTLRPLVNSQCMIYTRARSTRTGEPHTRRALDEGSMTDISVALLSA